MKRDNIMLYQLALFLHITGALGLSAAFAVERQVLATVRKNIGIERLKELVANYFKLSIIGGISMGLILIPGIYMAAVLKGGGWITAGFVGLVLLGAIGGIFTGRKMRAAKNSLEKGNNSAAEVKNIMGLNTMRFSFRLRILLYLGIIFIMVFKPGLSDSFIALGVSIVLGIIPLKIRSADKEVREIGHELN